MALNKKRMLVIAILAALAWYLIASRPMRFTEEVALANGDVIDVERVVKTSAVGEIGGPGGAYWKANSLEIKSAGPGTPAASWKAAPNVMPILVDKDPGSGEWMVVATSITCEAWWAAGMPLPDYVEFRWRGAAWVTVPLSASNIGRRANLLVDIGGGREPARIALAAKQARLNEPKTYPPYATILASRETNCPVPPKGLTIRN